MVSRLWSSAFDLVDRAARLLGRVSLRLRAPTGSFILAAHRNIPGSAVAVPFAFFGFRNPAGSAKVVYIRRVLVYFIGTNVAGSGVPTAITAVTFFTLEKGDTLSGGVDISTEIVKKDDNSASPLALVVKRETSGEAAITIANNTPIRRSPLTGWGWVHRETLFDVTPDPELDDQIVLRAGDALAIRATQNAPGGSLSYIVLIEWDEE